MKKANYDKHKSILQKKLPSKISSNDESDRRATWRKRGENVDIEIMQFTGGFKVFVKLKKLKAWHGEIVY
jgi:hypothetical protein